ncbi:hypothetical protein FHE66_14665 [Georgenia sp. 311]|nr:hypothetical protein FHE66_14665 [Georgenia sp. 311]
MSHASAAQRPQAGLRLAQFIVDDGWRLGAAAKMYIGSARTAKKWAARYRAETSPWPPLQPPAHQPDEGSTLSL